MSHAVAIADQKGWELANRIFEKMRAAGRAVTAPDPEQWTEAAIEASYRRPPSARPLMSLLVNGVGVEVRGSIGAGSLLDAVERALHAAAGARPDSTVATKTYSVGDMVRLLKMRSKKALYAAVKRKQIPGVVRQGRRKLLFNSATIDAWLNKGGGRS